MIAGLFRRCFVCWTCSKRKAVAKQMRFFAKRTLIKKSAPDQIERAYRRMLGERETRKREERWFFSAVMRGPKG